MLHFGIVRPDERGLITNPLGLTAVRLIGIGRGLAAPLLPHHLAYGSRTKAVRQIQSRTMALI
jgi:hypothetical protein